MSQEYQEGENLAPQDRSEVTTGAARLGAALLNTSTEQPTHISELGGNRPNPKIGVYPICCLDVRAGSRHAGCPATGSTRRLLELLADDARYAGRMSQLT